MPLGPVCFQFADGGLRLVPTDLSTQLEEDFLPGHRSSVSRDNRLLITVEFKLTFARPGTEMAHHPQVLAYTFGGREHLQVLNSQATNMVVGHPHGHHQPTNLVLFLALCFILNRLCHMKQ